MLLRAFSGRVNVSRRFPRTLWVILAVAAGLRLLGAWIGNLNYDESMIIARAEAIDLRPGSLRLVWQTVNHPLLTVYVVKISGYLFGNSDFGLRILHVLLGTANVFLVFLLGKKLCSVRAGLWAAALLAVDRFPSHLVVRLRAGAPAGVLRDSSLGAVPSGHGNPDLPGLRAVGRCLGSRLPQQGNGHPALPDSLASHLG